MNKELLIKEERNFSAIGAQIPHELAAKMVKNHHDKHPEDTHSYYIGNNIIQKILAQPGCTGIRILDAINEAGGKTLVFIGIDQKGDSIVEYSTVNEHGDIVVTEGMGVDQVLVDHPIKWFS